MKIALTIDTERDLHSGNLESLILGIPRLLRILDKYSIKATFFVPALLLEQNGEYFIKLEQKGHEIALHGYEHERFDDLSYSEKEKRIKKSIQIYKKIFKKNPNGFRAPQHSIDNAMLRVLYKNGFIYDSSYTPFNFLQLSFFPQKVKLWLDGFFKPRKVAILDKGFYEIPTSSFLIPFVSLPLRVFPWFLLKLYLIILQLTNYQLVFYAHSWDFIGIKESRIDKLFSYTKLLKNLERTIVYLNKNKKNKFYTMGGLI